MSEVSESEADDEPAEFEITKIDEGKNDEDEGNLPSSVRNAEIDPSENQVETPDGTP